MQGVGMKYPNITRRKALVGIGATIVAGGGYLNAGTEEAYAQVEMGNLTMEPATFAPEDSQLFIPWILLYGEYRYRTLSEPEEWRVVLMVGDGSDNTEPIAQAAGKTDAMEETGSYAVRGPVTQAEAYSTTDFTVPQDEASITVTIPVEIGFVVQDAAGNTLAGPTYESDTAQLTVEHGGDLALVRGDAWFVPQYDRSDPTPTPPEGPK